MVLSPLQAYYGVHSYFSSYFLFQKRQIQVIPCYAGSVEDSSICGFNCNPQNGQDKVHGPWISILGGHWAESGKYQLRNCCFAEQKLHHPCRQGAQTWVNQELMIVSESKGLRSSIFRAHIIINNIITTEWLRAQALDPHSRDLLPL